VDNGRMKAACSPKSLFKLKPDLSAEALAADVKRDGSSDAMMAALVREAKSAEPLLSARLWAAADVIRQSCPLNQESLARVARAAPQGTKRAALDAVAAVVSEAADLPDKPATAGIMHDQVVWVTTPVRIDLSGGWTDTPPISQECGGCVVNAAVTLNGQYPVQAMAKLNTVGSIRLTSIDLSERVEIRTTEQLLDNIDPHHWAALPKAALIIAGIGPGHKGESLSRWLKKLGGGVDLTLFSALPKGSGMGTSSILGAAVLACLARVRGEEMDINRLNRMTSALEQRMKTGGGWQDQVGGMVPGVKRILTEPGPDQIPVLRPILLEHAWRPRMLLYYSGQKRMARGILENVVWGYLTRDPHTLGVLKQLHRAAQRMTRSLEEVDFNGFAQGVEEYWTLKKRIDPGSTNDGIETILERTKRWTMARLLTGAGGGGFILFVAKDEQNARRIRRELETHPASSQARFFNFDIDPYGLRVSVL
jgi:galactokinase/mevalonate kinase-like predicted kinase